MSEFIFMVIGICLGLVWSFTKIDAEQLNSINSSCKVNEGIEKVIVDIGGTNVYCKDGAKFRLKD